MDPDEPSADFALGFDWPMYAMRENKLLQLQSVLPNTAIMTLLDWTRIGYASRARARGRLRRASRALVGDLEPPAELLPTTPSALHGTIHPWAREHSHTTSLAYQSTWRARRLSKIHQHCWKGASGLGGLVKGRETNERTGLAGSCRFCVQLLKIVSPDGTLDGTVAPVRNQSLFDHKPNTFHHDRIVVPAGWDSWGKITGSMWRLRRGSVGRGTET
ncbi:hypothetical protein V8E53_001607 [Lactarius tabidus]